MNVPKVLTLSFLLGACACGHAAGTQPNDMSAAEHRAAADREDGHAANRGQDPDERCDAGKGRVCWTPTTNPTAEEHHQRAAEHRAASRALQDGEARACSGIEQADRDMSPFAHGADIRSVTQLREETGIGRNKSLRDAGATVVFRATPGLTAEWLQRVVDCHLARSAAVGHDMPEMAYCPLVPAGAKAQVRSVGDGFAVDVRADEPEAAAEIWRRAQGLSLES